MLDLCLTLAQESHLDLAHQIAEFTGSVPLIEIRLDCLASPELPELPSDSDTQFMATCRPRRQGGRYDGPEEDRLDLLYAAAEQGFQWVDLENDVSRELRMPEGTSVVRSFHSFHQFPEDLDVVLDDLLVRGGDLYKIAVQVSATSQLTKLLLWMEGLPEDLPRVIIGMDSFGQPSRLMGKFLGNAWTYVSTEEADPAAPGQFSLESARQVYRIEFWQTAPDFYGYVSHPEANPNLVSTLNLLFEHYDRKALVLPLHMDDIAPWLEYMDTTRLRFKGLGFEAGRAAQFNMPSDETGALRILKREGGEWRGFKTPHDSRLISDGEEMMVEQVAEWFLLWTGIDPEKSLIRGLLDA